MVGESRSVPSVPLSSRPGSLTPSSCRSLSSFGPSLPPAFHSPVLRSSLRSSLRCSSFGLTHSSRRACDSCPSSPRTGAGERAPARYTSSSLGFRHFVHTALPSASPGTGPGPCHSLSSFTPFHVPSLVYASDSRPFRSSSLWFLVSHVPRHFVPLHFTLFTALRCSLHSPRNRAARFTRVSRQGRSLPRASPFPPLGRP